MFGRKFQYRYSRGHRKLLTAVVIIVLVILAMGFLYYKNLVPPPAESPEETKTVENATAPPAPALPPVATVEPNQTNETNATPPAATPAPTGSGLRAEYFTTTNLGGDAAATGTVPELDIVWSEENPPADGVPWTRFSARFTGKLLTEKEGDYTFILTSDDGSRLFINSVRRGQDIWDNAGTSSTSATVRLTAGEHALKVEYRNIGGRAAKLRLEYWASALGIQRQVVPGSALKH